MKKVELIVVAVVILITAGAVGQTPELPAAPEPKPYDLSNPLDLLAGLTAGGGWDSNQGTAYSGAKIGLGYVAVDLGYDRLQGRNGFSTEISGMVPVLRWPGPQKDESKNFLRVYAEPGFGYRWGGGTFGGYLSGKVMLALFSDRRLNLQSGSPYIEFQRRFPLNSLGNGDNRIAVGIMVALCHGCGLD